MSRWRKLELLSARSMLLVLAVFLISAALPVNPLVASEMQPVTLFLGSVLFVAWIHLMVVHLIRAFRGRYSLGRMFFLFFVPFVGLALTSLKGVEAELQQKAD